MEEQKLEVRVVADPLHPDVEIPLGRRDRDHPSAAAPGIRMAAVVVIRGGPPVALTRFGIAATSKHQDCGADDGDHAQAHSDPPLCASCCHGAE